MSAVLCSTTDSDSVVDTESPVVILENKSGCAGARTYRPEDAKFLGF